MPPDALPTLVSTDWLAAHLSEPDLRVVDATWYLPHLKRDARAEHRQAHIPGAVYFDIDEVKDTRNPLPHMLPAADDFARAAGALGIGSGDRIVVYGGRYGIASARVWWSFRVFGHDAVAVLDGGFPKWRAEGRPLQTGEDRPPPGRFTADYRPELVRNLDAMRENVESRREQVVDARSHGRFMATEPEPRPGLRGGHIPGSVNVPGSISPSRW
jgi:thiosulfate/3-mercaptopyruvate sulfurtransferase